MSYCVLPLSHLDELRRARFVALCIEAGYPAIQFPTRRIELDIDRAPQVLHAAAFRRGWIIAGLTAALIARDSRAADAGVRPPHDQRPLLSLVLPFVHSENRARAAAFMSGLLATVMDAAAAHGFMPSGVVCKATRQQCEFLALLDFADISPEFESQLFPGHPVRLMYAERPMIIRPR